MICRLSLLAVVLAASVTVAGPPTIIAPPPGSGPVARAHTRSWHHRGKTVRMIRRTPEVMREDAARIKRGDLFSSWSNAASN